MRATLLALLLFTACKTTTSINELPDPRKIIPLVKNEGTNVVRISPDGKHIAALNTVRGKTGLAFFETDTMKPITYFGSGRDVFTEILWTSNERVVAQVALYHAYSTSTEHYGDLEGVDLDGKNAKMIFGERSDAWWRRTIFAAGWMFAVSPLKRDRLFVQATFWSRG